MPAQAQQVAPSQAAGRSQPQTTVEPPGGPFIRHAQVGRRQQYQTTGQAFGGLITQPLVAVPGYIRGLRLRVAATGGVSSVTTAAAADAPFSLLGLVQLKDAFGTPIITAPGYEALYLIPKWGGQYGAIAGTSDIKMMPTFSAVAVGASASGNFTFATYLPFEFANGYGTVSGANASLLPTLQLTGNPSTSVYTTAPNTTLPTLEFDVDSDFYWLPDTVIEPPGLGTTAQWALQQCNPTFASSATATVNFPRLGGYLAVIIMILRDSTGARVDAWPTRLQWYVDGVPLLDTRMDELFDDMAMQYGYGVGTTMVRDTGVAVITRKTSLGQAILGLLDTGEKWLSTNPGTSIAVQGAPWGTGGTPPYTLNVLICQIVPAGSIIQGLPEV